MLTDIQKIIQLMEHRKAKAIKHRNNNWDKGDEVAGYEFEGMSRAFAADIRLLKLFLKKMEFGRSSRFTEGRAEQCPQSGCCSPCEAVN